MEGNYIIKKTCKVLLFYFYNFFKTNLKIKSKFICRKIVNINIKKFLKGKLELTRKDIL